MTVRKANMGDVDAIAQMCAALWPDDSAEAHAPEVSKLLSSGQSGGLPSVYFVAETSANQPIGFVQVGLRSHADGCDPAHPTGFVEGWFVQPEFRGQGAGAALMRAGEDWSRKQGCREMGSDTWLDNEPSQRAHEALGYEVVDRCVHYRKSL